ncbi:hypothetical protein F4677DRAFT_95475 [Hypoxylon crocopeplum]|nr:hypothetical protein F4677DRAFT_95475 [Hypoxylon crocopeplum]
MTTPITLEAALPPPWTELDSEDSSDDDNDSVVFQGHEDPNLTVTTQSDVQFDDALIEDNKTQDPVVIHAREYQLEMFEESLKRNIIVAMETGTGKTQVAVLRIQAELEKSAPGKIVWFMAPTVALVEQQTRVLRSQIPAVQIKFLSGADGVQTWTDVRTWNDYLRNVSVVVSTYQVLLDALTHAFVRMDRISLIVLDEAHNCVGRHPGSKIMARYHESKAAGLPVPSILGLTASPIMRSKLDALELIEQTLDAVCRSPHIHREEFLSIVKRPTMHYVFYSTPDYIPLTSSMESLDRVYHSLDIYKDPYIIRLQADSSERSRTALVKALKKRDTYVLKQMQSLWRKSGEIQRELGPWAADYFIYAAVTQFLKSVKMNDPWFQEWSILEKRYLASALEKVKITIPAPFEDGTAGISDKVVALMRELSNRDDGTIGIIFVREVATVSVLSHILRLHPLTRDRFRIGLMVGTNTYTGRKQDLSGLSRASGYQDLEDFQNGKLNLLIATSVLEEGIDVPACNMVVCFDMPDNLKAFIQRRGRARMRASRLIMLMNRPTCQLDTWMALEGEMKKRYEDDMRQVQQLAELEESEQPEVEPLFIPETGAHLDFDQAKSHLEHFCRKISTQQHADSRPYYIFKQTHTSLGPPQITATVVLPMSLLPELRRVESSGLWYSEKNASKDAAFQAYVAIYRAGLLNDNLLPPLRDDFLEDIETRAGLTEVHGRWNPWTRIARAWCHPNEIYQRRLRLVDQEGNTLSEFDASLPVTFPKVLDFKVFWNKSETWKVEIGEVKVVSTQDLQVDQSSALIDIAYRHRRIGVKDTGRAVLHLRSPTQDIPFRELVGQTFIEETRLTDTALIRDCFKHPYFFKEWLPSLDPTIQVSRVLREEPVDVPWLVLQKWPRRRNFLREDPTWKQPSLLPPSKPTQTVWPAHLCRMDGAHVSSVCFGALIPSITHMIEIHLVVAELCNTLLKDIGFSDISLVTTAISASAAEEATNYQRLEFLGDTILKMLTTATVTANYPHYPEGYLDAIKSNIVSNSRLYLSALETGLDKFILAKKFTARKWQPIYVEDLLRADAGEPIKEEMSTKTLADVVEALIGAAFLDGGISKALICVQIFIPEVDWRSYESACTALFSQTPMSEQILPALAPLEELIGYSFRNKNLLVEATTHASFGFVNSTGSCMERLEFLGDAVLDNIVTGVLWAHDRDLSQRDMHLLRTACVNADLLGFLGMEWAVAQEATDVSKEGATIATETHIPFWKFLRHMSPYIATAQTATKEKHALERGPILDAIHHGKVYPWVQLAHLHIPKFFSDLFESVLGAVWVDSGASADACSRIVERAGILPYLRRMLADDVDVLHPKNHLGEFAGKDCKTVEYRTEGRAAADGSRELFCTVLVAGEVVVEVGGGVGYEEVQARAADLAYRILVERSVVEKGEKGKGEGSHDEVMA